MYEQEQEDMYLVWRFIICFVVLSEDSYAVALHV